MAEESAVPQVPLAFRKMHPKSAARFQKAVDSHVDELLDGGDEVLTESESAGQYYSAARSKLQGLLQKGDSADACIKAAESSISSVLQEFKTTQTMLDNLDDGKKCTEKGQMEIKRAAQRHQKAVQIRSKITKKKIEKKYDKDACKEEATAIEYEKTSLKEYLHAKEVAIELQRQCKCAVINNVHQLVRFSTTLMKVRAKTVVRETVLICITNAKKNGTSTKACKSSSFISSLEKATMKKLTLKEKVLAPGVASALCGPKEKTDKEGKTKEKKSKEGLSKEGGSKEGGNKEQKKKEKKKKVEEERVDKERKSKELKSKESSSKEKRIKDEKESKENTQKE